MAKKVGDTGAIRIYGPYPDERDPSKWTVHVFPAGATKPTIVPTFGFDLAAVNDAIRTELFKNVIGRAKKAGAEEAESE